MSTTDFSQGLVLPAPNPADLLRIPLVSGSVVGIKFESRARLRKYVNSLANGRPKRMPYKDPERKRQWEREHREERNARRRKSLSRSSPENSDIDAPLPDPKSTQVPLNSVNVATGVMMMGLAFLLTKFILMWRFGSSTRPVASTGP